MAGPHQSEWVWVAGHAGHELNERADRLPTGALRGGLDVDVAFEGA